jgi:hypothetical protein
MKSNVTLLSPVIRSHDGTLAGSSAADDQGRNQNRGLNEWSFFVDLRKIFTT